MARVRWQEWLCFGIAALVLVEYCQGVEVDGYIGVVRVKSLLTDSKGTLGERLCFGIAALGPCRAVPGR